MHGKEYSNILLLDYYFFQCNPRISVFQPLHYACAFGASEEVLFALTDANPEAIRACDSRKRTPLHFALSNAGRKTVPAAVRLLLNLDRTIVNTIDDGPLPLRVLAQYAQMVRSETEDRDAKRESVLRCLEHLLNAEPEPTPDFFTALQSLPEWLSEKAVVMSIVQHLLNEKISQRFPTAVLLLDFVFRKSKLCLIVVVVVKFSFLRFDCGLFFLSGRCNCVVLDQCGKIA